MTLSLQPKEKLYRETKQKDLEKILEKYCDNIEWIWIGANSRRKVTYQIDGKNNLGFFAEKTHNLIIIEDDNLVEKEIADLLPILRSFLKTQEQNLYTQATVTLFDNGIDIIFAVKKDLNYSQTQKLTAFAKEQKLNISYRIKDHLLPIFLSRKNQIFYPDFKIDLTSDIFIQATKLGLESIIKIIRDFLSSATQASSLTRSLEDLESSGMSLKKSSAMRAKDVGDSKNIVDLYAGFGAYSFAIQDLAKSISAFEGDKIMVDLIKKNASANNLSNKIKAEERDLFGDPLAKSELNKFDVAILNPPRNGASPQVLEIAKSNLKNLLYVSCNPISFNRDADILIEAGFKITKLFALDQFYGTNHLEVVAVLSRD